MAEPTQTELDLDVSPVAAPVRSCKDCGTELPLTAFRRHPHFREGYQLICSDCSTAAVRRSRGVSGEASYMKPTEFDHCAICGLNGGDRGLFLDHDHETGSFRGWLCHGCNAGVGHFRDDPDLLGRAIAYLEKYYDTLIGA